MNRPRSGTYDAVVIGGGHNGLVTAGLLARAGLATCVLERREVVGGACVTEEIAPGFTHVLMIRQGKVLAAGRGSGGGMLYEAAREKINARLGIARPALDLHQLLKDVIFGRQDEWLEEEMRALKPWAAFFGVWTRYRARAGWSYSLDLDAARIATALGKRIVYLETIEEQIAALEAVPPERFANFLSHEDWSEYCERYERHYRAGELDALVAAARAFPTYCEPIVERRLPFFDER